MNFKYIILEQIISEGRLEDMIKKYDGQLPEDLVRQLSAGDPSGNNKYLVRSRSNYRTKIGDQIKIIDDLYNTENE